MTPYIPNQTIIKDIVELFKSNYNTCKSAIKTKPFLAQLPHLISPQSFRDLLGEIRRKALCAPGYIVSDVNNGYWYTEDTAEMNDFLQKQLNRISNQYANIEWLHNTLKEINRPSSKVEQITINFGFEAP